MDWSTEEDMRLARLNRLLAAVGFERSHAQFADFPSGMDGATGWIGRDPYAMIAQRLGDAEAEATVLHEAAHWRLGHEDEGSGYRQARDLDSADGTDHHRAPYEHAANDLAKSWIEEHASLMTHPDASRAFLDADDLHFTA